MSVTEASELEAVHAGSRGAAREAGSRGLRAKIRAYVALTKPRIIELLLVTTVPTMILAAGGIPDPLLILNTLVGGALSAGSANAFNCYIDRDIDRVMKRTSKRPLVTGELTDREALGFSWITGALSMVWLGLSSNWFAAFLSGFAIAFYVVVYTMWLKRRTDQNIVWGGIAGCMPVFVGWAAVTGGLDWPAVVLFGLIFLWTPAHYWPLAVKYQEDYRNADVPMLPVVRGHTVVGMQVVLYGWALVVCSLLLIPIGHMGLIYSAVAVGVGAWFLWQTHVLYAESLRGTAKTAMKVFHGSIVYLSLLFLAVGVDPLLHIGV